MSNETPGDIFLDAFNAFYQNLTGSTDEQIQEMKKLRLTCGKLDEIDKALKAFLRANDLSNKDTRKLIDEIIKLQKAQTKMSGVSGSLSDKHIIATINRSISSPNSEFDKTSNSELMKQMLAADTETNKTLKSLERLTQETVKRLNDLGSKVANMAKNNNKEKKKEEGFFSKFLSKLKGEKKGPGRNILGGIKDFFTGKAFWGKMVGAIVDGIFASRLLKNTLADVLKLVWLLVASWFDKHFGPKVAGVVAAITAGFASVLMSIRGLRGLWKGAKALSNFLKGGKTAKNIINGVKVTSEAPKFLRNLKGATGSKYSSTFTRTKSIVTKTPGTSLMVIPETSTALVPTTPKTGTALVPTTPKTGTSLVPVSEVTTKTSKIAAKEGEKALIKGVSKTAGKDVLMKGIGKSLGKKVPGLGLALAGGLAADRASEGDWLGAGGEVLSGALSTFGGPFGMLASLAIDAGLMYRDYKKATRGVSTGSAAGTVGASEKSGKKKGLWSTVGEAFKTYFKELGKCFKDLGNLLRKIIKPILLMTPALFAIKTLLENFLPPLAEGSEGSKTSLWSRIVGGVKHAAGIPDVSDTPTSSVDTSGFTSSPSSNLGAKGTKFDGRTITSAYGMRMHPIKKRMIHHAGIDLDYKDKDPVEAKLGGKVVRAAYYGTYGNTVTIFDGKYYNQYSHLDSIAKGIKVGSYVKAGDIIGLAGSSGGSTGPHVHYEVRTKDVAGADINPSKATVERRQEIEKGEGPAVPVAPPAPAQTAPPPQKPAKPEKVSYDPSSDGGNALAYSNILDMKARTNMRNFQSLNC